MKLALSLPLSQPYRHRIMCWMLFVGMGLLPLVVGVGLFRVLMNADLSDTTPVWSDEIYYWHQANTFRVAGFNGGYYTANEQSAPLTTYYAWGVVVPMLYGVPAQWVGWSLYAIPLMNLTLLSIAVILFMWVIRATFWQVVWIVGTVVTFVPYMLFSVSSMLEVQQQATAIFLATAFYGLLRQAQSTTPIPRWQWAITVGVLILATLLRPTWGILFVPVCILALRHFSIKKMFLAILGGVLIFLFFLWLTQLISAPFMRFPQVLFTVFQKSPKDGILLFLSHILENIQLGLTGHPIEVMTRVQILLLIILKIVTFFWQRRRKSPQQTFQIPEIGLHLYNLGVIFLFNMVLYDLFDWRDFRVMTPHLLLSLMLLLAFGWRWIVGIIIVTMLLLLPSTFETYRSPEWYQHHSSPERIVAIEEWSSQFAPIVVYQPDASSAWCNTILHTPYYLFGATETLLAVPPGIGISTILDEDALEFPIKSQYVMLDNDFYQQYAAQLRLQPLVAVPNGMVSLNLDADCTP